MTPATCASRRRRYRAASASICRSRLKAVDHSRQQARGDESQRADFRDHAPATRPSAETQSHHARERGTAPSDGVMNWRCTARPNAVDHPRADRFGPITRKLDRDRAAEKGSRIAGSSGAARFITSSSSSSDSENGDTADPLIQIVSLAPRRSRAKLWAYYPVCWFGLRPRSLLALTFGASGA